MPVFLFHLAHKMQDSSTVRLLILAAGISKIVSAGGSVNLSALNRFDSRLEKNHYRENIELSMKAGSASENIFRNIPTPSSATAFIPIAPRNTFPDAHRRKEHETLPH